MNICEHLFLIVFLGCVGVGFVGLIYICFEPAMPHSKHAEACFERAFTAGFYTFASIGVMLWLFNVI